MSEDKPQWGEWQEHDGGPCPVQVGESVFVRYRDGTEIEIKAGKHETQIWKHRHDDPFNDIIAYRVRQS